MSTTSDLSEDVYRQVLRKCWDINPNHAESFSLDILTWLRKKQTELGVPLEYLSLPLISSVSYCMGVTEVEVTKNSTNQL